MMNKRRVVDYAEVSELFDKEFKETMQLIKDGETHLDNLAEGFVEADRILFKLICMPPMTNGDRIRAMSDEELAKHIVADAIHCPPGVRPSPTLCVDVCFECWKNWLKQPAEESNDTD